LISKAAATLCVLMPAHRGVKKATEFLNIWKSAQMSSSNKFTATEATKMREATCWLSKM
jgi:hypothetical protein